MLTWEGLYITHFDHALELSCKFMNACPLFVHHVHDVHCVSWCSVYLGIVALPGLKPCHAQQTSQAKAEKETQLALKFWRTQMDHDMLAFLETHHVGGLDTSQFQL